MPNLRNGENTTVRQTSMLKPNDSSGEPEGKKASRVNEDIIGSLLGGRYRVLELIGQGGLGAVYKVVDINAQQLGVLKILQPHLSGDAEFEKRFLHEARILAGLRHPNIVTLRDFGATHGSVYLAMEFIDGPSLDRILQRAGLLDLDYAIEIIRQVGEGLRHAHNQGIIHNDIKPSNILVSNDGRRIVLSDFGLATPPRESGLTDIGTVLGTVLYMSPEQIVGQALDARADIYQLATVLYQLLTGRVPHESSSLPTLFAKRFQEPPQPIHDLNPRVPRAVEEVVLKALAKDPAYRFQSMDDFIGALISAHRDLDISERVGGPSSHQESSAQMYGRPPVAASASAPRIFPSNEASLGVPTTHQQSSTQMDGGPLFPASSRAPRFLSKIAALRSTSRKTTIRLLALTLFFFTAVFLARSFPRYSAVVLVTLVAISSPVLLSFIRSRHIRPKPLNDSDSDVKDVYSGASRDISADQRSPRRLTDGGIVPASPAPTIERGMDESVRADRRAADVSFAVTMETLPYRDLPLSSTIILRNDASAVAWLLVLNGPARGVQYRVSDQTIIGRAPDCHIVLNDPMSSRRAAGIRLIGGQFYVEDLRSANGICVNGVKVEKQELRDRDEILIGGTIMLFIQAVSPEDLTVEAKRRLREFEGVWDELTASVRHD